MKKNLLAIACGLFACTATFAVPKYWVGPANGNWNNSANWSLSAGGPGSAGVPDATDSVIFNGNSAVNVDVSPTVLALTVGQAGTPSNTILFTSQNVVLTVLKNFFVQQASSLTDSTAASVAFNVTLSGANASRGLVYGTWIFSGNTALTDPLTQGAYFSAEAGSTVSVGNGSDISARIIFRNNSGRVNSSAPTFGFASWATCVFDNVLQATIPAASWTQAGYIDVNGVSNFIVPATILFSGNLQSVTHLATAPGYGSVNVDLPALSQDANLNFPNGTVIGGNLSVLNTNNNTVVLCANESPVTTLSIRYPGGSTAYEAGSFNLSGTTSKVALSKPASTSPAIAFSFSMLGNFVQSGGNFSLQDNDISTGSVVMSIKSSLTQTGGTLFTNSAATGDINKFVVSMNGPLYLNRPGGLQNMGQAINLSSGAIESPQHQVTLRLQQTLLLGLAFTAVPESGIVLSKPLSIGKMQFIKGVIHSSVANPINITNPDVDAVPAAADSSYVDGPVTRATNSTGQYLLPVGGTPVVVTASLFGPTNLLHYPAPFYVIPSAGTASVYSGQYFRTNYSDSLNYTAPLQGISKGKYWDVSKVSGSDAAIRLVLREAIAGATFDKAIVVAHYEGSSWVAANGTTLTPGTVSAGSVTSKVLSSFSPFTFGLISGTDIPLPIRFSGFTARKTGQSATLDWSVENSPSKFEIQRSSNGTDYSKVGELGALLTKKNYQFIDDKILKGSNYYRIRSIEADGNSGLSVVNVVINSSDGIAMTYLAPSLVKSTTRLYLNTAQAGRFNLMVTDMSGKTWQRLSFDVSGGNFEKTLNFSELPSGVYQLTGSMNGLKTEGVRFVKQ